VHASCTFFKQQSSIILTSILIYDQFLSAEIFAVMIFNFGSNHKWSTVWQPWFRPKLFESIRDQNYTRDYKKAANHHTLYACGCLFSLNLFWLKLVNKKTGLLLLSASNAVNLTPQITIAFTRKGNLRKIQAAAIWLKMHQILVRPSPNFESNCILSNHLIILPKYTHLRQIQKCEFVYKN